LPVEEIEKCQIEGIDGYTFVHNAATNSRISNGDEVGNMMV